MTSLKLYSKNSNFHICTCLLLLFELLPNDAQENCFQRSIKISIKITIAPTCFCVITIIREHTM